MEVIAELSHKYSLKSDLICRCKGRAQTSIKICGSGTATESQGSIRVDEMRITVIYPSRNSIRQIERNPTATAN